MSANSGRQEKGEKERSKEYIKLKSKQRKLNLKWQARRCVGPVLCWAALTSLFRPVPRSWPSPTQHQKARGNACLPSDCELPPVMTSWPSWGWRLPEENRGLFPGMERQGSLSELFWTCHRPDAWKASLHFHWDSLHLAPGDATSSCSMLRCWWQWWGKGWDSSSALCLVSSSAQHLEKWGYISACLLAVCALGTAKPEPAPGVTCKANFELVPTLTCFTDREELIYLPVPAEILQWKLLQLHKEQCWEAASRLHFFFCPSLLQGEREVSVLDGCFSELCQHVHTRLGFCTNVSLSFRVCV